MSEDQAVTDSNVTTRRVLLGSAGAIGAGLVLAGCGGDSTDGGGDNDAGEGATGAATASPDGGSAPLAMISDIPVGGGKIFADQGVLVTQPTAGTFKAFDAVCTHKSCPIAAIAGGTINCTCHGSKFSIEDGSVKNGPATNPLPAKEIKVDGDAITLA